MGYMCDFCGDQRSIVYCRSDAACLCLSCDRNVHLANALSKRHSRTLLCERCNSQPALVRCAEERVSLCQNCDWIGHGTSTSASSHKRQTINCYSGCPSASELSSIWSFVLDFPSVGESACEQELGLMSITDNSIKNSWGPNEDSISQNAAGGGVEANDVCDADKSNVRVGTTSVPGINSTTHFLDQIHGSANNPPLPKLCCSATKGLAFCEDDDLYEDFNMDEMDLNFENYEELFGVTLNHSEELLENGGIESLFGTKDMSAADSNCQGAVAAEGSSAGLVNAMQPACSNAASADSIMSTKTEPILCFTGKQGHSNLSFSGLTGDSNAGDYQDCDASSMLLMGEPPWCPPCPETSFTSALQQGQVLKVGEELVSAYGNFRLGFFSPSGTRNRYLAIYYKKPRDRILDVAFNCLMEYPIGDVSMQSYNQAIKPRPVWIANRDTPVLRNESATLIIDSTDGNLKILRNGKSPIEISSVRRAGNTTRATLLKNGNLVLYEMNSDGLSIRRELWQSFDYPTDTLLPGMKLGINLQTGHQWFLRCSRSAEVSYRLGLGTDPNITNKLVIWKDDKVVWTSTIWLNGSLKSGIPGSVDDVYNFYHQFYNFSYTSNEQERYLTYSVNEDVTSFPALTFDSDGRLKDDIGIDISCTLLGGCEDQTNYYGYGPPSYYPPSYYSEPEGGKKKWWFWLIIAAAVVLGICLLLSLGYIIRRKHLNAKEEKRWMSLVIVIGVVSVVPLLSYVSFLLLKKLKAKVESMVNRQKLLRELGHNVSLPTIFGNRKTQARSDQTVKRDLKIFDFQTIAVATDNFSPANRLGQGGFGPVYKGKLQDEQEIAIKRLSKSSGQGIVEFKNEAKLIAKLQHTNLVRLLGCSLQGGERLLVYEYLPNKSLDFFIFDSSRKGLLDWKKRFSIIDGIAQGLLYLHKYSRLRVIHRDLKVSNILLDEQMNPKISDFGMARTFAMNELEANTNRIVGTHGYMSPEYVMNGIVSMKSDVYSFGVLVLEIISSKKNNGSYDTERPLNLVGYAWQLWNEGKALELMDPTLDESCSPDEVIRCIHVGLLCVQDRAADRPTMSDVVSMLTNDTMALSKPKQPAFYINISSDYEEPEVTEIKLEVCSVNDVTISRMEGR